MTKVLSAQDVVAAILTSGQRPLTYGFSSVTESTSSVARSEDGVRLVGAFLRTRRRRPVGPRHDSRNHGQVRSSAIALRVQTSVCRLPPAGLTLGSARSGPINDDDDRGIGRVLGASLVTVSLAAQVIARLEERERAARGGR